MLNGNLLVDNDIDALGRLLKKINTAPQGGVEISSYAYTNWTKKFRTRMRQVEAFSGVQVVTYCVMTNHVHLLLRFPNRKVLSDREMLVRLEQLSSPAAFAQFMDQWNRMVLQEGESGLDELRQSVMA